VKRDPFVPWEKAPEQVRVLTCRAARVQALRDAICEGRYRIDPLRLADAILRRFPRRRTVPSRVLSGRGTPFPKVWN
jgi:hypothetical protein